jgi:2,3-bisphosphoglycerate-independent phosphoglycerate mutase
MGNSEVGHLNIGAGRVVYQDYTRINQGIKDGSFFKNPALIKAYDNASKTGRRLHLFGLLSDGGVHSHQTHLYALLDLAVRMDVKDVRIHIFLDGRDVPPQSAITYIKKLEKKIEEKRVGSIATVSGRYYAMDRDRRWDRTKKAYDAIVYGIGETAPTAEQAVQQSYDKGVVDEFVLPTIISDSPDSRLTTHDSQNVRPNDSVIFFNFRPDRARQLTRAFIQSDFKEFDRGACPPKTVFVTMTEYDATFKTPVAFSQEDIKNTLAHVLSENGLKQLHIAETEKYAHVTFFLNGGVETPEPGEDRVLIPSPKVSTYDKKPEMSALKVTDAVVKEIKKDKYDVVIMNYANADMVGHTADLKAAIKAIETVDKCIGRVYKTAREAGAAFIVTADHGNADQELDRETWKPFTAHSMNEVPFILAAGGHKKLKKHGILADIAPTVLDILRIKKPQEMTGKSLIVRETRTAKREM